MRLATRLRPDPMMEELLRSRKPLAAMGGPYCVNVITTIILFVANLPQLPQLLTDIPKKIRQQTQR